MPVPKAVRTAIILTPTFVLVAIAAWFLTRPGSAGPTPATEGDRSKLVVLVVFDQMRGDYPDRWASAFGPDGFERMKLEGVWYANCHLPYSCSSTAPGHASIATGAPPSVHGIVENEWHVRGQEKKVYCVYGDEPYRRVPASDIATKPGEGLSPERLLVPTVAEIVTAGPGRAFSLSLKDRSAILMGGKAPTGAYCFDNIKGEFHTSSYYGRPVHPWVDAFNKSAIADRWQGRTWDRLLPVDRYLTLAGPDDVPGEGKEDGTNRTFPYKLPVIENGFGKPYYTAVEYSPHGNDLLWQLAETAIRAEELGRSGTADLLCLSFSSNDLIGHNYGPDSQEVLDITARSDRLLADMIAFLDEQVGPGKYSIVVTADHGICPLPEVAKKTHPDARRMSPAEITFGLDEALKETFGPLLLSWFEKDPRETWPWVYLNRQALEVARIPVVDVEKYAEQWLGNRDGVQAAFGSHRLTGGTLPATDPARKLQLAFRPDRCGDVCIIEAPFVQVHSRYKTGTGHGTPHDYDTHVPVFAFGAGVPKLGRRDEPVSSLIVAPLLCRLLGVEPPTAAKEPLPAAWSK